jgi:plasmid stabilization system protein ParE
VRSVLFRPAAAADVEAGYQWYEAQRPGLGEEFLLAVRTAIESVRARPLAYPMMFRQTRRLLVRRFPYLLCYRVYEDAVVVVGCLHARTDPRRWKHRK